MEVNNNKEINKMFGSEDDPVTPPPEPELQTSPLGESSPASSPFQSDVDDGMKIPDNIDFSDMGGEIESANANDFIIGDHNGFGFAKRGTSGGKAKIICVLVLVLFIGGVVLGWVAAKAYFFGLNVSAEQSAAETAMKAVHNQHATLPTKKIIFTDVYVNNKLHEFECIVFAVVEDSRAKFRTDVFRVIIDKSTKDIEVFFEFNQENYDELVNRGNDHDLIQAKFMLNQKHEFERCLAEILNGKWVNINPAYVSARMLNKSK